MASVVFFFIIRSICGFQGTFCMSAQPSTLSHPFGLRTNGDGEIRTLDPLLARQVLSQLSYTPMFCNQLFAILITCLHAIMPSMIPMHVTPLKRCGSTLIKGDPIFISFIILNSAVYPVSMLFSFHGITLSGNGLKWTRTTDLTLIRRAL